MGVPVAPRFRKEFNLKSERSVINCRAAVYWNQQVDPVVTTPVDEVEAHFTRLLSDIRIKRI